MKLSLVIILTALLVSCAKHEASTAIYEPILTFSGRLLVMSSKHRFQVEIDWQANEEKGKLRLTHGLSGRVVFVQWQDKKMFWRDNDRVLSWAPMSVQDLTDMGVILPPWTLAKIFLGQYPPTMQTKDNQLWKGAWNSHQLQIKWTNAYKRVEIQDFKKGRRAVVIINE